MSAPASEDLRELERLLDIGREVGAAVSIASLREDLGVGHDDLQTMLDVLREHGKAVEESPGAWIGGDGAPPAPAPVEVTLPQGYDPEHGEIRDARELDEPPAIASVRLTRGMVAALEPDALGKLIQAGIADAAGAFILEIS